MMACVVLASSQGQFESSQNHLKSREAGGSFAPVTPVNWRMHGYYHDVVQETGSELHQKKNFTKYDTLSRETIVRWTWPSKCLLANSEIRHLLWFSLFFGRLGGGGWRISGNFPWRVVFSNSCLLKPPTNLVNHSHLKPGWTIQPFIPGASCETSLVSHWCFGLCLQASSTPLANHSLGSLAFLATSVEVTPKGTVLFK